MADAKKGAGKEEEAPKAEPAAKPKSKKKLIIIIAVVVLILGGAGAFFMMKGGPSEEELAKKKQEEEDAPKVLRKVKLDPFIVNLSEAKSFLKVTILLEFDPAVLMKVTSSGKAGGEGHGGGGGGEGGGEGGGGLPPEMMEKEPIVRDAIIRVLSSKTTTEVLTVNGKAALKEELLDTINEAFEFSEPVVVNIFFTEFIIQ